MSKLYEFDVKTTIMGRVRMTVEDDETPDEVAGALAADTVSYEEMERSGGSVSDVETECDDFREVKL